jgi:hypothetical protein
VVRRREPAHEGQIRQHVLLHGVLAQPHPCGTWLIEVGAAEDAQPANSNRMSPPPRRSFFSSKTEPRDVAGAARRGARRRWARPTRVHSVAGQAGFWVASTPPQMYKAPQPSVGLCALSELHIGLQQLLHPP